MGVYDKIFDPPLVPESDAREHVADRASNLAYVYDDDLVLAVNVALATGRPLLLRGRPGTGKSSLARNVALHLRRRFYPHTISSRTQARDLLWTVDDVARLSDATSRDKEAGERSQYVVPGVLWWAFDPDSAARRGLPGVADADRLTDPNEGAAGEAAVVLLDEIDKADPDVPNDLLEPLGLYRFHDERGEFVTASQRVPLVVLTTNEERDLPKAFLRRCVVHLLSLPTRRRLREIATVHLGATGDGLYDDVALALAAQGSAPDAPVGEDEQIDVSIAEYLDAVAAIRKLRIARHDQEWTDVLAATTAKPTMVDFR
jgi:MoxR-like ATPase